MEEGRSFDVQHLATFTGSQQNEILNPTEGMRQLLKMNKTSEKPKMILCLDRQWITILHFENGKTIERFPLKLIVEPTSFPGLDPIEIYNNTLVFVVEGDPINRHPSEMHVFHCLGVSSGLVAQEMKMYIAGSHPSVPHLAPNSTSSTHSEADHAVYMRHLNHIDIGNNKPLNDRRDKDVTVLNHCFNDISRFVTRLQHASTVNDELERRTKPKSKKKEPSNDGFSTRARPPTEIEYIDIFQKFKLSINLLAKLKPYLQNPNAPDVVHHLFEGLEIVVEASYQFNAEPNLPSRVIIPLLTHDAIQLLSNCLSSQETVLWKSLGDAWHSLNSDTGNNLLYVPTFMNGWTPDASFYSENTESDFEDSRKLAAFINEDIIGKHEELLGPFGKRRIIYCDYTASGRSLKSIETFIQNEVLPTYGNRFAATSVNSSQTTLFREEARDILRRGLGASAEDAVIFVGSGSTGAIHKLVAALHFTEPPIVFIGAYEHHSNLLPWKEIAAKVIRIQENSNGLLDTDQLEDSLKKAAKEKKKMIGCFSTVSNVTGTLSQDLKITALLHRYGALSFWDYATAAPYVNINMNPTTTDYPSGVAHKDALYFSMHKFVGGVQTPGVLVVKKSLLQNPVPHGVGGGAVSYVDRDEHFYLSDAETREEGGTPAIVESIRAGLVFQLKLNITADWIMERQEALVRRAYSKWGNIPELVLLGSTKSPRLAIFSLLVCNVKTEYYLHHDFVCILLNDLYGIQARGGCASAGPYALDLLSIDQRLSRRYKNIHEQHVIGRQDVHKFFRPGFVRLNLPYFASDAEIEFVLNAVVAVAKNGWTMLPYYQMNSETGEWHHHNQTTFKNRKSLGKADFIDPGLLSNRNPEASDLTPDAPSDFEDCLRKGEEIFFQARKDKGDGPTVQRLINFDNEVQPLRWFLMPSEAKDLLRGVSLSKVEAPFKPRKYADTMDSYAFRHYSTISAQNNWPTSPFQKPKNGSVDSDGLLDGILNYQSSNRTSTTESVVSIPPPPPPVPAKVPESNPTQAIRKEELLTKPKPKSSSNRSVVVKELETVLLSDSDDFKLNIRKTPGTYITSESSPEEVRQWLKTKEFDIVVQKRFNGMKGEELFKLKKADLEKYCGKEEGRRLYSQLTLQRKTSGYPTINTSELQNALKRARTLTATDDIEEEPHVQLAPIINNRNVFRRRNGKLDVDIDYESEEEHDVHW